MKPAERELPGWKTLADRVAGRSIKGIAEFVGKILGVFR